VESRVNRIPLRPAPSYLLAVPGLSQAQMAPARGWPTHNYWTTGLFQEAEGAYCALVARDYPVLTFQFQIVEAPLIGTVVHVLSTRVPEEVQAREVRFAADGFPVLTVPAKSLYARLLTRQMGNMVFAKLSPDNKERLWRAFLNAGVVTAATSFGTFTMPTEGFKLASADFEQCLAELDLVSSGDTADNCAHSDAAEMTTSPERGGCSVGD
jgi:hypothetical protein